MYDERLKKLYEELENYEHSGISMMLNDCPASPMQIVSAHMVKEERIYMRDYVWDEKGHVKKLGFHDIKEEKLMSDTPLALEL